jgi:hypothetical protein
MCGFTLIHYICGHRTLIRELDTKCIIRDAENNIIGCSLSPFQPDRAPPEGPICYEDHPCPSSECRVEWTVRRAAVYHMSGITLNVSVFNNTTMFNAHCAAYRAWQQENPGVSGYPIIPIIGQPMSPLAAIHVEGEGTPAFPLPPGYSSKPPRQAAQPVIQPQQQYPEHMSTPLGPRQGYARMTRQLANSQNAPLHLKPVVPMALRVERQPSMPVVEISRAAQAARAEVFAKSAGRGAGTRP